MAEAIVIGSLGAALVATGVAVLRGHRWLLANYDASAVGDDRRVSRLAGGAVVVMGLVTVGFAWRLRIDPVDDWWWFGWTVAMVVIGGVTAVVASGRR